MSAQIGPTQGAAAAGGLARQRDIDQSRQRAIEACEQFGETIHLLLTDVVMPNMNGRELAERLSDLRPQMKVIFMSGYTDDAIVHHGVLNSGMAFVQKPLTVSLLLGKLREVLDVV